MLNKNVFETICAFLNRNGGHLILGVNDNGKVRGILKSAVQGIIDKLVTSGNNPQKLNPTHYLTPQIIEVD